MKKITFLLIIMIMSIITSAQSIPPVSINLDNDSVTGLIQKREINQVLINFSLKANGELDTNSQSIIIYVKDVVLGANGDAIPNLTQSKNIFLKKGTQDFNNWFSVFNENFINRLTQDLTNYKDSL